MVLAGGQVVIVSVVTGGVQIFRVHEQLVIVMVVELWTVYVVFP
jgi:hypothetical protein